MPVEAVYDDVAFALVWTNLVISIIGAIAVSWSYVKYNYALLGLDDPGGRGPRLGRRLRRRLASSSSPAMEVTSPVTKSSQQQSVSSSATLLKPVDAPGLQVDEGSALVADSTSSDITPAIAPRV